MATGHKHVPVVYVPDLTPENHSLLIEADEAHHLLHVLRVRQGQPVELRNGNGIVGAGTIATVQKKRLEIHVTQTTVIPSPTPAIHLIIAPIRPNRMEWLIEKATELGTASITPVATRHTAVERFNTERMTRVAISALKQSRRAYLPTIVPLQPWETWLAETTAGDARHLAVVAHPGDAHPSLKETVTAAVEQVSIFIGPEGGFHAEEIARLHDRGFQTVRLGNTILRTETAALAALAQLNLLFL